MQDVVSRDCSGAAEVILAAAGVLAVLAVVLVQVVW